MGRIQHKIRKTTWAPPQTQSYERFDVLDGRHSWQTSVPDGCVLYPTRKLQGGSILYFNYVLAKEMGLIPQEHPNTMNKTLEKKILEIFAIRIINEFDQKQNVKFHPSVLKQNPYMATRYLQLQHDDKCGRTSGDGRSVWNGQIHFNGTTWDVSSRGTGVTKLSPGAVEAQKPLKSGSTNFGYGCGLADVDELIGSAIMAEIFHNNGVPTERVLAVIDIGGGNGIGVRAAQTLFRPAHLFSFLKQGDLQNTRRALDYVINRQIQNKKLTLVTGKDRYQLFLDHTVENFAKMTAKLDRDYIFAWLDWDGDNILVDAGIIDYGSIRQFGLRHDQYRYDDVDRFSTNLNEQKKKAEQIIQTFAQLTEYAQTGVKKKLDVYRSHSAVRKFQQRFKFYLLDYFMDQVGLTTQMKMNTRLRCNKILEHLYLAFLRLESTKTHKPARRVPDGLNRPAILNMRRLLRNIPLFFLDQDPKTHIEEIPAEILFEICIADTAHGRDRKLTARIEQRLMDFQKYYLALVHALSSGKNLSKCLEKIAMNSEGKNRENRMTGDGLLYVVDKICKLQKTSDHKQAIQFAIDALINEQSTKTMTLPRKKRQAPAEQLMQTLISLIDVNKESI